VIPQIPRLSPKATVAGEILPDSFAPISPDTMSMLPVS
jgi:hypothetical protein